MVTPDKKNYIDAVRGWAILMVITTHVGGRFPEMPYPIKKLTNFGWNGVQLFFLASAVTLLMSWHRQKNPNLASVRSFFIRRYLRIAPMYYAGALIYYVAEPPESGFGIAQMLRSFVFINAWHPDWIPTTPGWMVVPGGWSIGVEFSFYFLFPALAALVITLPRSILLFVASVGLAVAANHAGADILKDYGATAVNNFLYFWFPNQAPVFALGFVLYFIITKTNLQITSKPTAYGLLAVTVASWFFVAEYPFATNRFGWGAGIPPILIVSISFMAFIFILAKGPETVFTHPWIRRIGVLSFSAYVLHFLFAHKIPGWSFGLIDRHATGYTAIATGIALWVLTATFTLLGAAAAHRWIEQPAINLAHRLTPSRRRALARAG